MIETRWKASRSALLQLRKVRQGDGLGRAGQREAFVATRASSQLAVGPGTGESVPERRQRGVRDWRCAG